MIDGAGTEFPKELFSSQVSEIVDQEWPEMKDIVSGKTVSLLHDDYLRTKHGKFYGCSEAAGPGPYDENLRADKYHYRNSGMTQ